jgi:hypothetical protein
MRVRLQPIPPKVIPVAAHTWILSNLGYNEVVTFAGNEVFLFDATQGEKHAELDAEQIERLVPGKHKINVVVTDLAWPHVAGVRYWVSRGATIISHQAALSFLQRMIERRWTLAPDQLELKHRHERKPPKFDFVPISGPADFAKGAVRVIPIDGVASEVALMAYLPAERFLWASDYIQTVSEPSLYAREVIAAAQRNGVTPERAAAEHLPLTEWRTVVQAQSHQRTTAG